MAGLVALAEAFERRADQCTAMEQLLPILHDASGEIGFNHVALTLCSNLHQTAPWFRHFDTYPAVYADVFVRRRLYRFDPVLHAAQRRISGFAWRRVGDIIPLRDGQTELMRQAAREGLRDGYTVPANVPGEPCGAVSFGARLVRSMTPERRWCADCLGRTAFEASRRFRGLSALPSPVPHLNNREVQCLNRLMLGDSDKEVARALDISPETVRQYVKKARGTYRARTRAHLIALALRDSQIAFGDEAIPPIGGTDPD